MKITKFLQSGESRIYWVIVYIVCSMQCLTMMPWVIPYLMSNHRNRSSSRMTCYHITGCVITYFTPLINSLILFWSCCDTMLPSMVFILGMTGTHAVLGIVYFAILLSSTHNVIDKRDKWFEYNFAFFILGVDMKGKTTAVWVYPFVDIFGGLLSLLFNYAICDSSIADIFIQIKCILIAIAIFGLRRLSRYMEKHTK